VAHSRRLRCGVPDRVCLMARIQWVDVRLTNWARWRIGGRSGGLGYSHVNLDVPVVDGNGYDAQSIIPIDDAEASVTDSAISGLPSELRRTVEVWYLHPGSIATKGLLLACERVTIYTRLDRSDRLIAAWLGERSRMQQAERERVEKLQRVTILSAH